MAANLEFRLTGGLTNTDPSLSLGGITSNSVPIPIPMNNLFRDADTEESANGTGDYLCLDIVNIGDETATLVSVYSSDKHPYSSLNFSLGFNDSLLTRNLKTHPSALVFAAYSIGDPLSLPDIEPGGYQRIWIERIINRNSKKADNDIYTIAVGWDMSSLRSFACSWRILEGSTSYNSTNLIDHIPYKLDNKSNIDVRKEELEGQRILDVPVFPPQNIVIDDDSINIYSSPKKLPGYHLSFVNDGNIYALTDLAEDQRMVFVRYGVGSRDLIYRFGGKEFPQDRKKPSFALTEEGLLMWGGQDSKQVDRRELWHYHCAESTWYALHPDRDTDLNKFPSMRYSSSLCECDGDIYIFGGSVYSTFINKDLSVNDLWWKSKDSENWTQLDLLAKLPHIKGVIVYVNSSIVKIIADDKLWVVPKDGTEPLSENFQSDVLTFLLELTKYTFTPISGEVHFVTSKGVFKWNNSTETFSTVLADDTGIEYNKNQINLYIQEGVDKIRRGDNSQYQPLIDIYHPRVRSLLTGLEIFDCYINAVPVGDYMASCSVGDTKKYLGLGITKINGEDVFIEDHWIWDGETLNTNKVAHGNLNPQERLEASSCWDKKRNRIWLFGGYSGSQYYNDLWYLDLTTLIWTRVRDHVRNTVVDGKDIHPQARAKAAMACIEDSLWILSGYSDQRSFNDMWEYFINTDEAVPVQLNDWVPFGTDYEIFEWRDRMWMFNGEDRVLYRYFYDFRLWQPVLLYASRQDLATGNLLKKYEDYLFARGLQYQYSTNLFLKTNATIWLPDDLDPDEYGEEIDTELKQLYIEKRGKIRVNSIEGLEKDPVTGQIMDPRASVFLLSPITVTVKGNYLLITYNELNTINTNISNEDRIKTILVDLDSKEVMPLPGNIYKGTFWVNPAKSMSVTGQLYYYNISSFELAQWNQLPYFDNAVDPVSYEFGMTPSSVLMSYYDPDTVGGVEERFCYFDKNNMYVLYQDQIAYSSLVSSNQQLKDGIWGEYQCQTDYTVLGTPVEPVFPKESIDYYISIGIIREDYTSTEDYPGILIKAKKSDQAEDDLSYYEMRLHNGRYRSPRSREGMTNPELYEDFSTYDDIIKMITPIGDDWQLQNIERYKKSEESFRECPRFLWRRVPKGAMSSLANSELHWKDETTDRIYSVNGKDGSIQRISVKTRTSLTYPTKLWKEGAYTHSSNTVYAFGGSIIGSDFEGQYDRKPKWYTDLMKAVSMGMYRRSIYTIDRAFILDSHDGFMKYDLSTISLQMNMLAGREKGSIRDKDYDGIRNYLISAARSMGIEVNDGLSDDWLTQMSETMYSSTLGVAGDMSVRFFKNEKGTRPFGPRSSAMSVSVGSDLYVFGGCFKYFSAKYGIVDKLNISVTYQTSFPYNFTFDDEKGTYQAHSNWTYGDSYVFNTQKNEWKRLKDLPVALFGGTAIVQPDGLVIWIIGGFVGNINTVNNNIYKYTIKDDKWERIEPLPTKYKGRGKPNCAWIDDERLMILFGFQANTDHLNGTIDRKPWGDCWILDKSKGIVFKFFENNPKTSICVENLSSSENSLIDMFDFLDPVTYLVYQQVGVNTQYSFINEYAQKMVGQPDDALIKLPSYISRTKVIDNVPHFYWSKIDSFDGSIKGATRIDINEDISNDFCPSAILDIFKGWNGDLWMVMNDGDGSKPTDRGLEIYRLAKINDYHYFMDRLAIDRPAGNQPALLTGYLGNGKVLIVWNEFNIYELDIRLAAYNPNGKYWRMLPPEPQLYNMGISQDVKENGLFIHALKKELIEDGVIRFYRSDGSILRYDRRALLWRLDRENQWDNDYPVVNKDGDELNYYRRGTTDGRIFNVKTMQSDKFYYDAELLKPDMDFGALEPYFGYASGLLTWKYRGLTEDFGGCMGTSCSLIKEKMSNFLSNNRSVIKRGRIYTWNENNHLMQAWTRKHGDMDLTLSFDSFFKTDRIDISVDYDTLEQAGRFKIQVLTNKGWINLSVYSSQEATGWDWTPSNRVYRKQIMLSDGYTYIENTRPGYYIRANTPGMYIKGVRIKFFPKAEEWNYIARINHIYIVSDEKTLSFINESENLRVYYVAPFSSEDSDVYEVKIRNNHPLSPVSNVEVYLNNNFRVYLSIDHKEWILATKDNPLKISKLMSPSESFVFYLRMKNSIDKSAMDFILKGDYPLDSPS